jgi:hypothetical protein
VQRGTVLGLEPGRVDEDELRFADGSDAGDRWRVVWPSTR